MNNKQLTFWLLVALALSSTALAVALSLKDSVALIETAIIGD